MLLSNHIPLQGWLIGAHEFEGHHVFDILYRNTSDIVPTAITGESPFESCTSVELPLGGARGNPSSFPRGERLLHPFHRRKLLRDCTQRPRFSRSAAQP